MTESVVCLRDVTEDDLPVFFEHQCDPEATRMAGFPARDRDAFMAHWAKILGDDSVFIRTIVFGDRVAGNVVCFRKSGMRLVGYWVGREYWGKGVATRALLQFIDQVTARPIHAQVAVGNLGSIRVLEKCGFTPSDKGGDLPGEDGVEELLYVLDRAR